ncbi:hypothetical protein CC2G_013010 [Coprinopsis cinerea AmutBmut pab1-1]|nr:hypothetical protein CC2G_013010 [Coprinopsis cinerea AmutBmut pab1-1]
MVHSSLSTLDTIELRPHPTARDQALAKAEIPTGSTILKIPAFATVLQFSQKGNRCDHCMRLPTEGQPLRRCTGCSAYWYCDAQCQSAQWQTHHKRICKRINQFTSSTVFQGLEEHEKMDALLLNHLVASLSTLPTAYNLEQSQEATLFLSLLPGPSSGSEPPLICTISPPPKADLIPTLFERFGNNNFTMHSHLNSIAHGIFPLASRSFNHSCSPNAAPKYTFSAHQPVIMEVVALKDIHQGEEICIPYLDPALTQTKRQIFQFTYGFNCNCPACLSLSEGGEFVNVDSYLKSDKYQSPSMSELPQDLHPVLNEDFMKWLSETFSKASHEANFDLAAESGIALLALYLLVYPCNYPQIGMHLLEMAKTHWNYSFVISQPSKSKETEAKAAISRLLELAKRVLDVLGREGDEDGPLAEISVLQNLLQDVQ